MFLENATYSMNAMADAVGLDSATKRVKRSAPSSAFVLWRFKNDC